MEHGLQDGREDGARDRRVDGGDELLPSRTTRYPNSRLPGRVPTPAGGGAPESTRCDGLGAVCKKPVVYELGAGYLRAGER